MQLMNGQSASISNLISVGGGVENTQHDPAVDTGAGKRIMILNKNKQIILNFVRIKQKNP